MIVFQRTENFLFFFPQLGIKMLARTSSTSLHELLQFSNGDYIAFILTHPLPQLKKIFFRRSVRSHEKVTDSSENFTAVSSLPKS